MMIRTRHRVEKPVTTAGAFYFRQYEIRKIYSTNFYRAMLAALGLHLIFFSLLVLLEPGSKNSSNETQILLPPVGVHFRVLQIKLLAVKASGMDRSGSGGGNGIIRNNPAAAYGIVQVNRFANRRNTIDTEAIIVPRSIQGPGMNDIIGINRSPVSFDTSSGFHGTTLNGIGSGGGIGTTIGDTTGAGSGLTGKPGFGGGFGNRFVPGNPADNSATGEPYSISWNDVPRVLLSGDRPVFPPGVEYGGEVKIRIVVDPSGNVVSMVPVEVSDSKFEESAMTAIRTWEFSRLPGKYPQVDQRATADFVFRPD
jgi:TonB family protein